MTTNVGSGAYYNIKLRLYRDHINANPNATMPFSAQVGIYDASTHANVTTLLLSKTNPTLSFVALGDACSKLIQQIVQIGITDMWEVESIYAHLYSGMLNKINDGSLTLTMPGSGFRLIPHMLINYMCKN